MVDKIKKIPSSGGYFARRVTLPWGSAPVLYSLPYTGSRSSLEIEKEESAPRELLEYGPDPKAPAVSSRSASLKSE
jgi:hypothetical protein